MEKSANFKELRRLVFAKQHILSAIYSKHGNLSLFDYVSTWQAGSRLEDSGFLKAFKKLIKPFASEAEILEISSQLELFPLLSTIDHHGFLNHPYFLNSNLIYSLKPDLKYLICLPTAGVSLNNSSYPASLVWNDAANSKLKRLSFFSDKQKTQTVLACPGVAKNGLARVLEKITPLALSKEAKERLSGLLAKIFSDSQVFDFPDFSSQASLISPMLWQIFFPRAPKLVYLPLEKIVSEILTSEILPKPEHILNRLFTGSEGLDLIEKHFQGSLGAFSGAHKGSFLFWGINQHCRRVHLVRQGSKLVGKNFSLEITPGNLAQALAEKKIYPGSLVCFIVLLFSGVTCLGGFNQVNWLTEIRRKFLALLEELGESALAARIRQAVADNFAESNLAFLFKGDGLIKASGIDIFLHNDPGLFVKYRALAGKITLAQSVESLLPEIYRVITPVLELNSELLSLTDEQIIKINMLENKIKSVLA